MSEILRRRAGPRAFPDLLIRLRWAAAGGQTLAILAAVHALRLPLPTLSLWAGVAALVLFNLAAIGLRRRALQLHPGVHLAVDIALLSWQLQHSGGIANPFVSLYLVPIALAAVALPRPWVYACMATTTAAYLSLALWAPALPHVHGARVLDFDLHLAGMAVNFLLSAGLFAFALGQLAHLRSEQERELSLLRERAARDQGIVALGTHAAAMAHALNTPLGSLQLILDDLDSARDRHELDAEIAQSRQLVQRCRDQVRGLVERAQQRDAVPRPLDQQLTELLERWRLTHPHFELRLTALPANLPDCPPQPLLEHALTCLLDNAAEASGVRGSPRIELAAELSPDTLRIEVRDHGPGPLPARTAPLAPLFESSKAEGLGIGLALSQAGIERLGGRLALRGHPQGGSVAELDLPIAALKVPQP